VKRLVIARHEAAADGVVVLDLRETDGSDLPAWAPGAHIDLSPAAGVVRQYSLCGDPADRTHWRIAVLREPDGRGGSRAVHDRLHEDDLVETRGPRNHFPLVPAPRYLFVAGGIGITPLLPMIAAVASAGADWRLHYGGRSRGSMAFRSLLCSAYGARVSVHPQDETGLLDLDAILADEPRDTPIYCCGPEPLLRAIELRCPDRPLHLERFAPSEPGEPVRAGSFEVELARTGRVLTVPPGRSILRAVQEAGVEVLWSCTEGTCGTCETTVLDGAVDHRDSLLTPAERAANDTMFICVSRAAGPRLILDL
jgi:ferredoxin-NADP reductase